jgi:hypothetical protein
MRFLLILLFCLLQGCSVLLLDCDCEGPYECAEDDIECLKENV